MAISVAMVTEEQVVDCAAIMVGCRWCAGLAEGVAEQECRDEEKGIACPALHDRTLTGGSSTSVA